MNESASRAACTIVSPNYLSFARVLAASYMAQHPAHHFFVLIVADISGSEGEVFACDGDVYTAVMLEEIGLADLRGEAMKYDILELNTNVKPTFMQYLLKRYELGSLVYLDPDIYVYSPLTPVFEALDAGATAVLTPHITTPYNDDKNPSEQDMLYNGTYNLGFVAVRACTEGLRLLRWWESRCLTLGFSEGRTGLFVDQKWMNLTPGLFAGVHILRHPGCNMAYWNLHERGLIAREGTYLVETGGAELQNLCFFHFSGVVVSDTALLSKHTNRFTLADRPDLNELFAAYKAAVLEKKSSALEGRPYGFDRFSDGKAVTRLARRIYAKHQTRWDGGDPFDSRGGFAEFARRLRLVADKAEPPKATWREFNPTDRRVEMVHRLLRTALRVLGPNRYELLMRYLSHISVLRNQSVFLDDKR